MNKSAGIIGKAARGFLFKLRSRPLVWDTITTTSLSTVGKGIGFFIPFFIAAWFGVSAETDAFFFAYGLILFLAGIFAPVIEGIIVPYVAETRAKGRDVGAFVGQVLGASALGLIGLAVLFLLVSKPVLGLITRFSPEGLRLIQQILIETAPLIVLLVWTSILAGTFNAYKRFALPALSPAFRAVVTLTIIFLFRDAWGVHAIARGYVLGEVFRLVIFVAAVYKLRLMRLRISLGFDPKLREFLKTASYQMVGAVGLRLNPFVDKTMASWLGIGSISVLHYADRLYWIPLTFIIAGLLVTLLSHWSGRYYESGQQKLKEDVKKAVKITSLLTFSMMIILILFRQPLVRLAFGRGAFTPARLPEVERVWMCYLFGFTPYIIGQLFARAHLTLKNTKVLMRCFFYMTFLNVLFNYILMKPFKIAGIALATTFVSIFSLFYLGSFFYKRPRENLKL